MWHHTLLPSKWKQEVPSEFRQLFQRSKPTSSETQDGSVTTFWISMNCSVCATASILVSVALILPAALWPWVWQHTNEMSTRNLLGVVKGSQPERKINNLPAICEPTVWKMWKLWCLTSLRASQSQLTKDTDPQERTTPPETGTQHNRALPKPNTHHRSGINAAPQPQKQPTKRIHT
jgi:hypothetical protein